ncbi:MAG: PIN domain-containing protein [Desulfobacterales bacterium]|nr:PIN domain-containing protein [Desulfobacterales bacterium]
MAAVVKYTIDTSFAVKGLVPPRRKKRDKILHEQKKMYKLARSYLDKVRNKEVEMYIPAIALVETGIVISRITNNEEDSRKAISFLRKNATHIFYDHDILEQAISFGIKTKASGYDTMFLIVTEVTESELLTDDSLQYKIGLSRGIVSHLLSDMI